MIRRLSVLCLAMVLTACATPYVQPPLTPPAGFVGPYIEDVPAGQSGAFVVQDGARLPYLHWAPAEAEPWAVIVALHGMNDSRASFRLAGPWWAEQGIETWAYDQRGFGEAPGRGLWAGEATLTTDLRTVVALVRARHPDALVAVVGESMGGSIAVAAFASDQPPAADRLILLAPGVWGWSSQGWLNGTSLWFASRLFGDRAVEPPEWAVRDIRATDNILELIRNGRDPNSILATRFDTLSGLVGLMETASQRLGDTRVPTLLLYGAHDQIVTPGPMRLALERAGASPTLRTAWYPDGWHLLDRDLGAVTVYGDVVAALRDPAAPLPSGATAVLPQLQATSPGL
ncbi:alpha/beta fold hydrolase [uncultured Brevundimonas sp.]|uniref:alpha/beta fold hydrolase n=1 Tax=uncultured Brevundimonas sp. TaxID=213418 RepID=UPI0030ED1635|tara:strand:- start:1208 stop:2239 length:1032 start_codon:yes stop_codon:yes gene_type:complete